MLGQEEQPKPNHHRPKKLVLPRCVANAKNTTPEMANLTPDNLLAANAPHRKTSQSPPKTAATKTKPRQTNCPQPPKANLVDQGFFTARRRQRTWSVP